VTAGRPTLSICVPTYNRAGPLEGLLRCLAADPEVQAGVPVLVADNGSPDGTAELLARLQRELPLLDLRVHRQPGNIGAVANTGWLFVNAPETDYVWCLADDDEPVPGGVGAVLDLLAEHRPRWLHLPHRWESDGVVRLASPCPPVLDVFPTSRELFLAYTHWLTFISASVVEREALARAAEEHPTQNEWAPLIWYVLAGRDAPCMVADRLLVVGTAGTSWDDKRVTVLTDRVVEAFEEGLREVVTAEEYGRTLDGRYENGLFFECWQASPIEKLVAAVERFPSSRQLRAFLWALAREQGRPDAIAVLDRASRSVGAGEEATRLVSQGEERFAAGDAAGAAEAFVAALRELPTFPQAWNDLGVALHALGQPGARDAVETALALDPGDEDARANLAAIL
jgi:hypothetical protein